ncbi:MAG: hypothetical protein Q4G69_07345 [Planctomycetia bacterium]|nr:hypothetical protein [Planctomycetia bacterium]
MADTVVSELMVRLHSIHRQISELNGRLRKGGLLINLHKEKGTQLLQKLEEVKQEENRLILEAKNQENLLKTNEETVKKRKGQLLEAKNNKEYSMLKVQIELDEKENDRIADEALTALTAAEDYQPTVDLAQKEYDTVVKEIKEKEENWVKEKPIIEADLIRCKERLNQAEKELNKDFKELYKRLVEGYGGEEALAPIVNQVYCGHCNHQIPIHFINEVNNGSAKTCPSCGRLLYIPEGFVIR